jgi:hypothetical protein
MGCGSGNLKNTPFLAILLSALTPFYDRYTAPEAGVFPNFIFAHLVFAGNLSIFRALLHWVQSR